MPPCLLAWEMELSSASTKSAGLESRPTRREGADKVELLSDAAKTWLLLKPVLRSTVMSIAIVQVLTAREVAVWQTIAQQP
jgi:hypothetical protein